MKRFQCWRQSPMCGDARSIFAIALLLFSIFTAASTAFGQTVWIGGVGIWDAAANWSAGVPGFGTAAQINNGGTALLVTASDAVGDVTLGSNLGQFGTLEVAGGSLPVFDFLTVGSSGNGTMYITSGGRVSSTFGWVGFSSNSVGAVTVDGPGSLWDTTAEGLVVGYSGTGAMTIQNLGLVRSYDSFIGLQTNSHGAVSVIGPGATWTNSSSLTVGNGGTGSLAITNGGQVTTTSGGNVGAAADSHGSVVIDGAGSKWIDSSLMAIGGAGTGTVTVAGGGELQTPHLLVNRFASGEGTLLVTGTGSKVTVNGEMRVADEGIGLLRIENGGTLITDARGYLARNALTADATAVVTGAGSNWTLGLSLAVGGAGFGRLAVEDGGVVSAPSGVTVNARGTVGGNGTIVANVANSGIVAPGTSPGTLHISGDYTQTASGMLVVEIASALSFDKLDVSGSIGVGGTLDVLLTDGFVPHGSQSFDILDWGGSLSGTFSSIQLPTLGGLLSWDTSQLYTNGVLSVIGPAAAPGDFDGDGDVDGADFVVWQTNFPTASGAMLADGDADGDGDVDGADFVVWQTNFPFTPSPGVAPVPEPQALLLALLAAAGFTVCRRRAFGAKDCIS